MKLINKKSIAFLAIYLLIIGEIYSQQPVFKNYNVKDGLPSTETYCSFQDSKGFIWVLSDAGVARFDGYSFKTYSIENGLADNTVFGICEDKHGRIWFRSLSGRICYLAGDSIYKIGANDSIMANIKNSLMISFYVDSGDTLWCGIRAGQGYYKINPGYTLADFHRIVPQKTSMYIIKLEGDNYIYGNTLSLHGKTEVSLYQKDQFLGTPYIENLDPTNIHYIKEPDNSFLETDLKQMYRFTSKDASPLFKFNKTDNGMITCFLKDKDNIWISKRSKGIDNYIYKDGKIVKGNINYLKGYSVTDVMTDNEGGTWFTTLENGLYYLSPSHFIREYSLPIGPSSVKYMINRLDKGHITISRSKDTIDIVTRDTIIRSIKLNTNKTADEILGYSTYVLPAVIKTGTIYEANNYAAYVIFKHDGRLKPILDEKGYRTACYLNAVDTVNKEVYAMDRYYLYLFNDSLPCVKLLDTLPSRTLACYLDDKGVLWLGCLNGLWSYEHNKLRYHGDDNPYLKSRMEGICQDKEGTYYFATYGNGIIIKKNDSYSRLTTTDGLISNNCQAVFNDSYGTIWVGYKGGTSSIVKNSDGHYSITKYNLSDAFPSQTITQIEQTGNKLWLSAENGIISHTLPAVEPEPVPSVFVTQFVVNDSKFPIDKEASLNYTQNRIKISFIGLSYNSFGKIEYRYRLIGLDTAWHTTQTPNVQYQFLPAGSYDFSVMAIATNGKESRSDIHLIFTINKPFWQAWWFISLAALIVIAIFYFRLKAVEKKEHEKTLMNKRIADIEMKALRAQMNPHFIFNAINSIQSHILKNDSKTAQDYLAKFARLIRNVLENSKLEYIPLGQEMDTLTLYISLEQLRAGGRFKFDISIDPDVSTYNTLIPPLLLQPFVENSILHGLATLQDGSGVLKIHIKQSNTMLVCTIEDNGIGRKKAGEIKKHREPGHRSMGISATEDRINILNSLKPGMAKIWIEDIDNGATGTKVTITIPLKKVEKMGIVV